MKLEMELFTQMLVKEMQYGRVEMTFPDLKLDPGELVEMRSYAALCKIKEVIQDPSLDDPECFRKIEEIICTLEFMGSGGGFRHDFG